MSLCAPLPCVPSCAIPPAMAMISTEMNTLSYPDGTLLPYSTLTQTFATGPFQVDSDGNTVINQPGIYSITLSAIGRSAQVQLSSGTASFPGFTIPALVDNNATPPNSVPLSGRTVALTTAMLPVTMVVKVNAMEPAATRAFLDFQLVRLSALAV